MLLLAGCGASGTAPSAVRGAARSAGLHLVRVGVFDQPTYVTGAPGDTHRVFVVEKSGKIVVLVDGHRRSRLFLNITKIVNSSGEEQGLLSMAFAPNYSSTGVFYVDYTSSNNDVHVVQYRRSGGDLNLANPRSADNVLTIGHRRLNNHNGGQLQFGPDGDLYVGVGDGGSEGDPYNHGQNTDVLLGKLLRIQPRPHGGFAIPKGNPSSASGASARQSGPTDCATRGGSPSIGTGALVIGDVGQNREEEVDYAARGTGAGANYGWSIWEGDLRYKSGKAPHAVFPVLVTKHSDGYCAIIGGYVVRDRALPSLYGRYVYGDLCKSQINSAKLSEGHATDKRATGLAVSNMSSFGEDTSRRIYAVSLSGPIYRIAKR